MFEGFQGALKWPPMMPRSASLSESRCEIFQSGIFPKAKRKFFRNLANYLLQLNNAYPSLGKGQNSTIQVITNHKIATYIEDASTRDAKIIAISCCVTTNEEIFIINQSTVGIRALKRILSSRVDADLQYSSSKLWTENFLFIENVLLHG